jgi:hypothetical protein
MQQFLFSRDSLYLWIIKTHRSKRRRYPQYFREPDMQHLNVVRIKSPRELERHVEGLQRLLHDESSSLHPPASSAT